MNTKNKSKFVKYLIWLTHIYFDIIKYISNNYTEKKSFTKIHRVYKTSDLIEIFDSEYDILYIQPTKKLILIWNVIVKGKNKHFYVKKLSKCLANAGFYTFSS